MKYFDRVLLSFIPRLNRLARARARRGTDPQDIVQATLVRALEKRELYRDGEGGLWPWVATIAFHCVADECRSGAARREIQWPRTTGGNDWDPPEDGVVEGDALLRERLEVAIDRLPQGQRVVVTRAAEGESTKEIAEGEGIPEGTVGSRLFRAYRTLRGELAAGR